jgi:hypothetical protein
MPYQAGKRLGAEQASKLGHLDVLQSRFVQDVVNSFESPDVDSKDYSSTPWAEYRLDDVAPLKYIFAVDGSMQTLISTSAAQREVAFVKTALLHLDPAAVAKLDPEYPHPSALRNLMSEAALFHATVFPLKNIRIEGMPWMDGVRNLIFESMRDPTLDGEPYETLKWILYRKWAPALASPSPNFECPECHTDNAGMPYNADHSECLYCGAKLFVSDVLGFHMEMADDGAAESLASAYMLVHETLMLFTAIRFFWEKQNLGVLGDTLFLKDGPLTLRGQYSKIVPNIRAFLGHAKKSGCEVHICGQEKTGKFVDHLASIARFTKPTIASDPIHIAILSHDFIRDEVQRVQGSKYSYGFRTNYGEKVYAKLNPYHAMVLSIPTGEYIAKNDAPSSEKEFIGLRRIIATLPQLVSYRHESALVPIELVNGIASLSNYPSAQVLKLFAGIE